MPRKNYNKWPENNNYDDLANEVRIIYSELTKKLDRLEQKIDKVKETQTNNDMRSMSNHFKWMYGLMVIGILWIYISLFVS